MFISAAEFAHLKGKAYRRHNSNMIKRWNLKILIAVIVLIPIVLLTRWGIDFGLGQSAFEGEPAEIKFYLMLGANINSKAYKGLRHISGAINANNPNNIIILINHGASSDDAMETALNFKKADKVNILLQHGIKVSQSSYQSLKKSTAEHDKKLVQIIDSYSNGIQN